MAEDCPDDFLTRLWERSDGTTACVVEHPLEPRWELCVVRRGRIVRRFRCATVAELMMTSLAQHARQSDW